MFKNNFKEFIDKLFATNCTSRTINQSLLKIFSTCLSIIWMIFIRRLYLIWWNGIKNPGFDKSFKWDEWIWFGLVPAIVPFIFYLIWKKRD